MGTTINTVKKSFSELMKLVRERSHEPVYRVVNIEQDEAKDYYATIQVIGKNITFKAKPEEILADDAMTDKFSPRDVRNLTYLGYLGINAPKYKILAKQMTQDNRVVFAIHKKGSKKVEVKTADELSTNEDIITHLDQKDAHMVGYTAASEQEQLLKAEKENLRAEKRLQK